MLVSLVIPCHNAVRWITQAVESGIQQTHRKLEIIVVDDSSTDGSSTAVQAIQNDVTLVSGTWRNGNSARNAGLAMARGEWIQFLDADDLLSPEKIEMQLAAAEANTDIIYSPLTIRNERTGEQSVSRPLPGSDCVEQWLRWQLCQTGSALWKTKSLRAIGGWKEGLSCCQDNEVILRALVAGMKIQFADVPGAVYRLWSEETVSRSDPLRVVRQRTLLIDECLEWLKQSGRSTEHYREVAAQACFEMARTWSQIHPGEAERFFRERRALGLINASGDAAPPTYRVALSILGFRGAERVAKWMRDRRMRP